MTLGRAFSSMLLASLLATFLPVHGADFAGPPARAVDPAKAKAQEENRQRLIAKLRSEAPKVDETPTSKNPLDAPIFHRYDRR